MARLVLVHGFTQTGASWGPVAVRLTSAGGEVIAPDAPGHGAAAAVEADLWAGADLLAPLGPAIFVGYSMGGRLCLHAALAHPEAVNKLVLIGATAGIEDAAERAARRQADEQTAADLQATGDGGLAGWMDGWLSRPLFAGLSAEAAGRDARLTNTAQGLASSLRLAGTGAMIPLWPRLAELEMPVLILAGDRDAKFAAIGARLAEAIGANARARLIPDAGHAAHLERPDEVATAILNFADKHDEGGEGGCQGA
jgi:2-succinyl-6-hydroxy-2,4-cyclohexadiene-1-carboxylate synthase